MFLRLKSVNLRIQTNIISVFLANIGGSNPSWNSIWRCPDHHSFHIIYSFVFYEWKLVHAFRGGSRLVELSKRRKPISFLKYRTAKAKNITNILVVSGVQIWTAIPAILSKTRAESWRHMFLPSSCILVQGCSAGICHPEQSSCILKAQVFVILVHPHASWKRGYLPSSCILVQGCSAGICHPRASRPKAKSACIPNLQPRYGVIRARRRRENFDILTL